MEIDLTFDLSNNIVYHWKGNKGEDAQNKNNKKCGEKFLLRFKQAFYLWYHLNNVYSNTEQNIKKLLFFNDK